MTDFTVKTLPDVVLTDHLRSIIERLDASTADIETCVALPPEVYSSEAWFEFEKRAVWDREWVCLGHIGQIPEVAITSRSPSTTTRCWCYATRRARSAS